MLSRCPPVGDESADHHRAGVDGRIVDVRHDREPASASSQPVLGGPCSSAGVDNRWRSGRHVRLREGGLLARLAETVELGKHSNPSRR